MGIFDHISNKNFFEPIKSIREVENCMVADFETISENHSFISGPGFLNQNCKMAQQALGIPHSNVHLRNDTTIKSLMYPSRPLFATQMEKVLGLSKNPSGQTVILAIMTGGFNQEDAIIFNQGSLDRGLFRMVVYKTVKTEEKPITKTNGGIMTQKFGIPPIKQTAKQGAYDHLDKYGIVRRGTLVGRGDCLVGKISTFEKKGREPKITDSSLYAELGQEGIVDKVMISRGSNSSRVAYIRIRQVRVPQVGDKFASRSANKSTMGIRIPEVDMPFTANGIRPDIILSPFSIPTRMTIAKLIELVASKTAALSGERIDATGFRNFDLDGLMRSLKVYGYNDEGIETLVSGVTGKPLKGRIFIGPCYYQALKHHVADKIQSRGRHGPIESSSRQPVSGRSKMGGVRFGEMERDALIGHGVWAVLQERLCLSSDAFNAVFCKTCQTFATTQILNEQLTCSVCHTRDLGVCKIPYVLKLFTQLLSAGGMKMTFEMGE